MLAATLAGTCGNAHACSRLPFLVGTTVSTWGMQVDLLTVKLPTTVLMALIVGVTYWLNQRVRRKQWLPMERELEALLRMEASAAPLDDELE